MKCGVRVDFPYKCNKKAECTIFVNVVFIIFLFPYCVLENAYILVPIKKYFKIFKMHTKNIRPVHISKQHGKNR